ncbi:thioredoxin [Halopseudomonas xinjiangensis]|uniref:Thioredoxin n=1 Tax=Halopseudomonas xinjiangensis TaxID=487184 RepID=A0A1H1V2Q7_9GAMM|nr:thioredoxin TrxC [Halopseudomonas xinjiangensis]SDS79097.1 thioredoxin [Halopseudomonas xinjiangensis]
MSETMILACPNCHKKNRLAAERLEAGPSCGACKQPLFNGRPVAVGQATFANHAQSDLPVVIDFWAPWCGPCRQFAPVFEQATAELEPRARLVKINTEDEPELASRYAIRSIPTLMIVRRGKEIARLAGALPAAQFRQWVNQHIQ